jgi:hypothetical protein
MEMTGMELSLFVEKACDDAWSQLCPELKRNHARSRMPFWLGKNLHVKEHPTIKTIFQAV